MRPDAVPDPLIGQLIGDRYRIRGRIGQGGMGAVYEAEHVALDKRVAIKFLLDKYADDPDVVERFHREARTVSRIGHDHIIDVTDAGVTADGRSYLVMELLEGGDLGALLARTGPMPATRAVHLVTQVLRGLGAAHDKGIVHRDMKPENVFVVSHDRDPDFVKIMDFGISKLIAASDKNLRLTATGVVMGTPVYMAPEQAMGLENLDQRVDVYAVGCMMFELLVGRPPFQATTYLGLVTQHLNVPAPNLASLRPDLPEALVVAVHRALEKEPERRYASANEMLRAMPPPSMLAVARTFDLGETLPSGTAASVAALPVSQSATREAMATPMAASQVVTRAKRSRTPVWIVGGAIVIAVAMVVTAAATHRSDEPAPSSVVTPALPTIELGSLEVTSEPIGATVIVDGAARGVTPTTLEVAVGMHEVRIEAAGREPMTMRKEVRAGRAETLSVALARAEEPPSPPPPLWVTPPVVSGRHGGRPAPPRPTPPGSSTPKPTPKPGAGPLANPYDEPPADKPPADKPPADKPPADKPKPATSPGQKPNPYDD